MRRARLAGVLATAVCVLAVALPVGSGAAVGAVGPCSGIAAPSLARATIAKVVVPADVLSGPGRGRPVWRAWTRTPWGGDPTWLLVIGCRADEQGRRWLRVALPSRPNGATGWLRADYVLLAQSEYRIEISTRREVVSVYRRGVLVRRARAVVGAPGTPTPTGLFAVYDPVPQPTAGNFVGPWVIHLTAHSNVLDDYGGGPGRVAIHGRGGASLRVPLGTAASHGCVRVDNDVVSWLARSVPPGSPVLIEP